MEGLNLVAIRLFWDHTGKAGYPDMSPPHPCRTLSVLLVSSVASERLS